MAFRPPHCPYDDCATRTEGGFRFRNRGTYRRRCDGRRVRRFACRHCRRSFSTQTFRVDRRLHKPNLWVDVFRGLVAKVTMRQMARLLGCSRKTVTLRVRRFGDHCKAFHEARLEEAREAGGVGRAFQLDELETYEQDRRLCPVTVPVLIERSTYFVVSAEAAPLPARGGLRPKDLERKLEREKTHGKRRSGSRAAVARAFELLERVAPAGKPVVLQSDEKHTYASELRKRFGDRAVHERRSSKEPRVHGSTLFPINHTLATMRDCISRLVRRTWAASKKAVWLERHQWIWIAWRNYVRGITNRAPHRSPAQALGLLPRQLTLPALLARRVFPAPGA